MNKCIIKLQGVTNAWKKIKVPKGTDGVDWNSQGRCPWRSGNRVETGRRGDLPSPVCVANCVKMWEAAKALKLRRTSWSWGMEEGKPSPSLKIKIGIFSYEMRWTSCPWGSSDKYSWCYLLCLCTKWGEWALAIGGFLFLNDIYFVYCRGRALTATVLGQEKPLKKIK